VGGLLFAMSEGATTATLNGVLPRRAGDDEQGWLAGGMSAIGSATQLVVPILTGLPCTHGSPRARRTSSPRSRRSQRSVSSQRTSGGSTTEHASAEPSMAGAD
jgi:hypothetical protein